MSEIRLSFVIPARNEEALIAETVEAILESVARASRASRDDLWLPDTSFEVIVADDASEDGTVAIVEIFADEAGVRLVSCVGGTCAAARNAGTTDNGSPEVRTTYVVTSTSRAICMSMREGNWVRGT